MPSIWSVCVVFLSTRAPGIDELYRGRMAAISATLLRQCPSFRPGVAYVLRNALYLQPCARNVAATSLLASRGPGFALPADCGFERLEPDAEPSAAELAALVDEVYAASTASSAGAMGESDAGVTFAGDGEPLLALETLISTVELLQVRRNGLPMRLVTSGLFGSEVAERLLGSGALAVGDADARRETRIASVSVAQHGQIGLQPPPRRVAACIT